MRYCENWEAIQKRYLEYWTRENHDRPLLSITAPKDRQTTPPTSHHTTLKQRWMDTQYVIEQGRWEIENTFYAGEAFPMIWPNLGPDIFAALYGTELTFGEDTSWAEPHLTDKDVESFSSFVMETSGEYYRRILEMTREIAEDGKDQYLVGITDLHPGADGLVSMRGPENLCFDTMDHPDFIKLGSQSLLEGFKTIYEQLYQLTTQYQLGTSNWMGVWHPGRWYVTSCDFSCMVSEKMFEDLIVGEVEQEVDFLDASIYHLDGPDALKHLNRILKIEKLKGVQWVYGAGQPSASHWIDVLQKIQDAGKLIHISVLPQELPIMLEQLKPEGVMYQIYASSEEEARALLKLAEKK